MFGFEDELQTEIEALKAKNANLVLQIETLKKNAEQERIKAKIETLTKFRYRSYESIEEELNNLKKQLENDK